ESIRFLANGQKVLVSIYKQDNTKPAMSFVFSANHKRIGVSSGPGQHKLADVRVGDVVKIDCYCYSGVMHCLGIEVHRRPGGRVPPAIGDNDLPKEYRHMGYDVCRNREQFAEECALELLPLLLRCIPH